ncbi:MAG: phosphoglucosamine mutase [Bacteroidales bacterium]|jgi:phosphomannomutase|nr:phosphoglucosamine mutase [Bacteroidales bacterium]
MALIKSISGIRGTIGGLANQSLTPIDVVKFTSGFAAFIKQKQNKDKLTFVIGRDARISGEMVNHLVVGTLLGMGVDVIDAGLSTTPTIEMAVTMSHADGGIILTASHNPKQWNALKLLNEKGEFINAEEGQEVLRLGENIGDIKFSEVDKLGQYSKNSTFIKKHIRAILKLPLVDVEAIKNANFKVVVDAVNSTGGIAIPELLEALGVTQIIKLHCTPNGLFPHNPEPLPEHLRDIMEAVVAEKAHVGFVVDPDVDRLAIVCEDGTCFGEEYTLVSVADYVLQHTKGNTVSNLSSTRALRDITEKYGGQYFASAVGEVNVVEMMKAHNAVIGGEGNGGVIYPELHYGRDALVGIALFLSHLAKSKKSCSQLRFSYPNYFISKNKIELDPNMNVDAILEAIKEKYKNEKINAIDGIKIDFTDEWVHLRKSNTEPIIRIYSESQSETTAEYLAMKIMKDISDVMSSEA